MSFVWTFVDAFSRRRSKVDFVTTYVVCGTRLFRRRERDMFVDMPSGGGGLAAEQ